MRATIPRGAVATARSPSPVPSAQSCCRWSESRPVAHAGGYPSCQRGLSSGCDYSAYGPPTVLIPHLNHQIFQDSPICCALRDRTKEPLHDGAQSLDDGDTGKAREHVPALAGRRFLSHPERSRGHSLLRGAYEGHLQGHLMTSPAGFPLSGWSGGCDSRVPRSPPAAAHI